MNELHIDIANHPRLCKSLGKYISTVIQGHYASFAPIDLGDKLGRVIYDEDKFTTHSLVYIFNMKKDKWKGHKDLWQLVKKSSFKISNIK